MGRDTTQFFQIVLKGRLHLCAPLLLFSAFEHSVGHLLVGVTQLTLNGLHLALQIVFALLFVNILFGFALDNLLHIKHLQFACDDFEQVDSTLFERGHLQQTLFVCNANAKVTADIVYQSRWVINATQGHTCFSGYVLHAFENLVGLVL